jgi:hypothetical protein
MNFFCIGSAITLRALRDHMLCGGDLVAEAEGFCFEIDLTGSFSWRNPTDYHRANM